MSHAVNYEIRKLFKRSEFRIAIIIGILFAIAGLIEQILLRYGVDAAAVLPASQMAMVFDGSIGNALATFVLPVLVSMGYADSYFMDRAYGVDCMQIIREGRKKYFWSKWTAVIISGFIIAIFPFIVNQIFTLIAFPLHNMNSVFSPDAYQLTFQEVNSALFPKLYMNAPYINNLAHILLIGIYGMVLSSVTYAFSLFFKKNRIAVVACTAILISIYLFVTANMSASLAVSNYLTSAPITIGVNLYFFLISLTVVLIISAAVLWIKCAKFRDEI